LSEVVDEGTDRKLDGIGTTESSVFGKLSVDVRLVVFNERTANLFLAIEDNRADVVVGLEDNQRGHDFENSKGLS